MDYTQSSHHFILNDTYALCRLLNELFAEGKFTSVEIRDTVKYVCADPYRFTDIEYSACERKIFILAATIYVKYLAMLATGFGAGINIQPLWTDGRKMTGDAARQPYLEQIEHIRRSELAEFEKLANRSSPSYFTEARIFHDFIPKVKNAFAQWKDQV